MGLAAYPMLGGSPRPSARRRAGGPPSRAEGATHLRLVAVPGAGAGEGGGRKEVALRRSRPGAGQASPSAAGARGRRHLRRLAPGLAAASALVGLWLGAGALAGAGGSGQLVRLPGARPVPGGYAYVVRPGDTLWSIASRLEPRGDPRGLVDRLASQVPGGRLLAGSVLVVP